ncbi:hypothetical protein [Sodalis sp. (in: enterobacteria)]
MARNTVTLALCGEEASGKVMPACRIAAGERKVMGQTGVNDSAD